MLRQRSSASMTGAGLWAGVAILQNRHSREGGNPLLQWTPAFAGETANGLGDGEILDDGEVFERRRNAG